MTFQTVSKFSIHTPKKRTRGLAIIGAIIVVALLVSVSVQMLASFNSPSVRYANAQELPGGAAEPPATATPGACVEGQGVVMTEYINRS